MIGAIVLAAGSSRRFGDDKRKARLPGGRLVIEQTTENALAAFDEVLLVLRGDDEAFRAELLTVLPSGNLSAFLAPDSALGMGHSLANAVTRVDHWDAAFICLADMPFARPETLAMLAQQQAQAGSDKIVVPEFNGEQGHPVGFGHRFFEALGHLTGDRGARTLLREQASSVITVKLNDPGLVRDIDTPADL